MDGFNDTYTNFDKTSYYAMNSTLLILSLSSVIINFHAVCNGFDHYHEMFSTFTANVIINFIHLPPFLINIINGQWANSSIECRLISSLHLMMYFNSFIVIYLSLFKRTWSIICLYLVVLTLATVPLLAEYRYILVMGEAYCILDWFNAKGYAIFYLVTPLICLIVSCFKCYATREIDNIRTFILPYIMWLPYIGIVMAQIITEMNARFSYLIVSIILTYLYMIVSPLIHLCFVPPLKLKIMITSPTNQISEISPSANTRFIDKKTSSESPRTPKRTSLILSPRGTSLTLSPHNIDSPIEIKDEVVLSPRSNNYLDVRRNYK